MELTPSSCSVSLVLKEIFRCGGCRFLRKIRRAPGPAYNESDEKSSLFLGLYLVQRRLYVRVYMSPVVASV